MPRGCSIGSGGWGARGRGSTVSGCRPPSSEPVVIATKKMKSEKEKKSLFICGHCGVDTRKTGGGIEKVIVSDYANMLCYSCNIKLKTEIQDVARKFLG